jgi:hypothetical protein
VTEFIILYAAPILVGFPLPVQQKSLRINSKNNPELSLKVVD